MHTGGRGQHGNSTGPDALFSQGAIKASATGKILAAVNVSWRSWRSFQGQADETRPPPQPGSNTLSVFKINPTNPSQITQIGTPVSSEGEFPVSLAINKDGNQVCALNGGTVNTVK